MFRLVRNIIRYDLEHDRIADRPRCLFRLRVGVDKLLLDHRDAVLRQQTQLMEHEWLSCHVEQWLRRSRRAFP